jgi:D-threo-aldose 1-dehydrogenase
MADPWQVRPVGRTGLGVTVLGFGAASIGGLYEAVDESVGIDVARYAYDIGIRYFDVAPMYGYGNSERRLGASLKGRARDSFVLSTKVGRLLRAEAPPDPGQAYAGQNDYFYKGTPPVNPMFDFSRDAILRSVDESLTRLGLDRIDILYIHDPDDHWAQAINEAYPALDDLRAQGVVRAIGAGMNQAEMLTRFAREGDFDVFLCAGRYTLLDQAAIPELLPACVERNVSIVIGGVMNSGLLANPTAGARFNYVPADAATVARALRLQAVCRRFDVPLKAAAIQFPLAHPAVVSVLAGVRSRDHLDDAVAMLQYPIPGELWQALRREDLIASEAPTPVSGAPV